jgi:membrane protease YdiL (CAAX protease family)
VIAAAVVVVAGSVALLARPWLLELPVNPVALLVVLFVLLLVAGAAWRLPRLGPAGDGTRGRAPLPSWLVLGVGVGAFGLGRLLSGGVPPAQWALRAAALATLAAVAEEAFYRRLAYGLAEAAGPVVAIGVSCVAFALVHVTIWGWGVLPLDLAAGLLLGWQRWASGRWSVPAATHVAANLLAVLP